MQLWVSLVPWGPRGGQSYLDGTQRRGCSGWTLQNKQALGQAAKETKMSGQPRLETSGGKLLLGRSAEAQFSGPPENTLCS